MAIETFAPPHNSDITLNAAELLPRSRVMRDIKKLSLLVEKLPSESLVACRPFAHAHLEQEGQSRYYASQARLQEGLDQVQAYFHAMADKRPVLPREETSYLEAIVLPLRAYIGFAPEYRQDDTAQVWCEQPLPNATREALTTYLTTYTRGGLESDVTERLLAARNRFWQGQQLTDPRPIGYDVVHDTAAAEVVAVRTFLSGLVPIGRDLQQTAHTRRSVPAFR